MFLSLIFIAFSSCKQPTGGVKSSGPVTVTFNMMGHGTELAKMSVPFGSTLSETACTVSDVTNWTFDGWFTEAYTNEGFELRKEKSKFNFKNPIVRDTTLYAKWTVDPSKQNELVTVTVNASDCDGHKTGYAIYTIEMLDGEELKLPQFDVSYGGQDYVADEWTGTYYNSSTGKIENTTGTTQTTELKPQWFKAFTVTFNMMGHGAQIPPVKVRDGGKPARPASPAVEDKFLEEWYTNENLTAGTHFNFELYTIVESITLYANWKNLYTITFDFNGKGVPPESAKPYLQKISEYVYQVKCTDGSSISTFNLGKGKIEDVTVDGEDYVFQAWYPDNTFSTGAFREDTSFTKSMTLYANWNGNVTITFDVNGRTDVHSPVKIKWATSLGAKLPNQADDGLRKFQCWVMRDRKGNRIPVESTTTFGSNTTLYAVFYQPITVTFSLNGKSGTAPAQQQIKYGTAPTKPTNPTATGWEFDYWSTSSTGGSSVNFNTALASNTIFYAQWKEK